MTPEEPTNTSNETAQNNVGTPTQSSAPRLDVTPPAAKSVTSADSTSGGDIQRAQPMTSTQVADKSEIDTNQTISSPVVMGGSTISNNVEKKPSRKKTILAGAIVAALFLLLGGGYVFGMYLPNTPANVYKTSMSRTAAAYDSMTELVAAQSKVAYKSAEVSGDMKFTSSGVSGEGTFTSKTDENNMEAAVNVNIAGEKATVDIRGIKKSGNDNPDIYLRVSGVKGLLDSIGADQYSNLDGQWIVADHTLLDTYTAALNEGDSANVSTPTTKQLQDALTKVGEVNRTYLFSTDSKSAVLNRKKDLGKSTQDGRTVYGYEVGYDKSNMKSYIQELGKALNKSSLNTWAMGTSGKSISETLQLDEMANSVGKTSGDYTFTMFVDSQTKLVHKLHFKNASSADYLEISQNYTGGNSYPFSLKYVSDGDKDNSGTLALDTTYNADKGTMTAKLNVSGKDNGSPLTLKANLNLTPSMSAVKVTAPTNAKPIVEVLSSLMGGLPTGASPSIQAEDLSNLDSTSLFQ